MKKTFALLIIVFVMSIFVRPAHAVGPKMVFASYQQGMPTYGNTVEDFKKEIKEAQAIGIDGFAYNVQSWKIGSNPKIFTAADESGFKILVSVDSCCQVGDPINGPPLIVDLIKTAVQHPSYYRYNNRPVVLTWKGESKTDQFWRDGVLAPLKEVGIDILFLPYFSIPKKDVDISNWAWPAWFNTLADGFNYEGASRFPADSIAYGEQLTTYMKSLSKLYMAGVSPYYFRTRHSAPTRDYIEYDGGKGIADQWKSIITVQKPQWVYISTWNDFTESYISPVDTDDPDILPVNPAFGDNTRPLLKQHAGYAQLMKYFIAWYKTGTPPATTTDTLFYFYRTHPKNLVASDEPNDIRTHGTYGTSTNDDGSHDNILDVIYVTTILKAPATLTVSSGGETISKPLAAGMQHTSIPFKPGKQRFRLFRNNTLILEKNGEDILSQITRYNFIPTTGYAYSDTSISGDLNGDGKVDMQDYTILKENFGKTGAPGWIPADIDKNGNVDIFDYNQLVANFGK